MSVKETRPAAAPVPSTAAREAAQGVTRRQFLRTGMYGAIGLFSAQALVGAGVMLWPAKVSGFGGRVLVPKKLHEFSPNDAPFKVREGKFYLSAVPEGIIALYWKCPHLGCTVPWNEGENLFHCPCHGSIYEKTGQNVGGPAPRPMDYMEIEIDGEDIWVDTSKIHERPRHLPEHVTKVKW